MWPIKNFEKYFMAHQYMPKIFHGPHKNSPAPSPTCLMYGPLTAFENRKSLKGLLSPVFNSCSKFLLSRTFLKLDGQILVILKYHLSVR